MRTFHFHFQFEKKNVFKVRVEGPDHLESQKSVKRASKKASESQPRKKERKKMFPSVFRKTNLNFFILFAVVVVVVVKTLRMQKHHNYN
jgi:hypothetical protein